MRIRTWSAVLLVLAACTPSDPAGWAKRAASRSRTEEKLQALDQARKAPGDRKAAVPALVEILKQSSRVRGQAALFLGEIGDVSAAPDLVKAIDPGASDRDGQEANRRVAAALGQLRAREAVPALVSLLASNDGLTQIAAVEALGLIGDPAAIEPLAAVATSPAVEPITAKQALLALGRIGDARAVPVVLHMLFEARQDSGVSFFPQASMAAVQIGRPIAPPLLAVLEGKDAELEAWAKEHRVMPGVLYAKAAQVLGEVGGDEATPALLGKLTYRDGDESVQTLVRVIAAEALGRLRARSAVQPIADLLAKETDPDARDRYCEALARIGDPAALPALRAAATRGDWAARQGALAALSRVGGAPELELVQQAAQGPDCKGECPAAIAGMKARLEAARACQDARCWAGKLADPTAEIRDRAALEVGRAGTAADASALAKAVLLPVQDEAGVGARYHAVLALSWIAQREKLGPAGLEIARQIDDLVASPAEKGRRLTEVVNEDALRLASRLRRQ